MCHSEAPLLSTGPWCQIADVLRESVGVSFCNHFTPIAGCHFPLHGPQKRLLEVCMHSDTRELQRDTKHEHCLYFLWYLHELAKPAMSHSHSLNHLLFLCTALCLHGIARQFIPLSYSSFFFFFSFLFWDYSKFFLLLCPDPHSTLSRGLWVKPHWEKDWRELSLILMAPGMHSLLSML